MAHWTKAAVTNEGVKMLNEMMAGRFLTVTSASGGSGLLTDLDLLPEQTSLIQPQQAISIIREHDSENGKDITLRIFNQGITEAYPLREIGVYAKLDAKTNPEAAEKLLFVMEDVVPDTDVITVPAEDEVFLLDLYCTIRITNTGRFKVEIDAAGIVTISEMEEALKEAIAAHNADEEAHQGMGSIFDAHNADTKAHPLFTNRLRNMEVALNGSETLSGAEDPTAVTEGMIGQHYINTTSWAEFVCTADTEDGYVWEPYAASGDGKSLWDLLAEAQAAAKAAQDAAAEANQKLQEAEESGGIGGGSSNTLKITFEAASAGATYTVTDGDETKTGTVPEGLVVTVRVANCNSTYTVTAAAANGVEYSSSVTTGAFFGQYTMTLSVFNATITVTAVSGASVTAKCGETSFSSTAGADGVATIQVNQTGTYTVQATYSGVSSNTTSVTVEAEDAYTAGVKFIVLTVTSEAGADLVLVNGETTLTGGGTGTDVFYLPGMGTWTATLTSPEETSTKSIEITEYKDYTMKVVFVSEILEENSWEKIREVADAGEGENYWDVGDTKKITLNGKVGSHTFSNLEIDAFIIGFNHNASREGNNRIDFLIGKIGGKMVGLCDSKYNSQGSTGNFVWNTTNTNSGGWKSCYKRKTLYGNDGTPENPTANSLMTAVDDELRANLKAVTKYTDNTGGGNDTASYVTSTTDYFFDLAEFEVHGTRYYANSAEKNYQQQYAYFKAGNSKIAYRHDSSGSAVVWGLRSPYYNNNNNFCEINTDGSNNNNNAYWSWALVPGFSI